MDNANGAVCATETQYIKENVLMQSWMRCDPLEQSYSYFEHEFYYMNDFESITDR